MSETKMFAKNFQQLARDANYCILEGFHALKHAIRFGAEIEIAVTRDEPGAIKLADELAPDVASKMRDMLSEWEELEWKKLGLEIPTGIIAIAKKRNYVLKNVMEDNRPVVLLEEPRNLGNVGAVIRVSAAANSGGVIMTGTIDPWAPAVIRGAAGLQYAIPVISTTTFVDTKRPIYALDPSGESLETTQIPSDAILVFGTERGGLSERLLNTADYRVAIPMRENVSSLNLATSVAIALYAYKLSRRS